MNEAPAADKGVKEVLTQLLEEVRRERLQHDRAIMAYAQQFETLWDKWLDGVYVPRTWYATLRTFYTKGLTAAALYDAVLITSSAEVADDHRFRYFCGVANNKIRAVAAEAEARYAAFQQELSTVVKAPAP
jgi:hypothetical protein